MNKEIIRDVKNKFEFTISIMIFLVMVIQLFFNIHKPDSANYTSFIFSLLVAFYILDYITFCCIKKDIEKIIKIGKKIKILLNVNLCLIAFLIMFLTNSKRIDDIISIISLDIIKNFVFSFFILFLIFILAGIVFIPIFIMIICNYTEFWETHLEETKKLKTILNVKKNNKNKEKILKLEYDHSKTILFNILAVLVAYFIVFVQMMDRFSNSYNISMIIIFVIWVIMVFIKLFAFIKKYNDLREFYIK